MNCWWNIDRRSCWLPQFAWKCYINLKWFHFNSKTFRLCSFAGSATVEPNLVAVAFFYSSSHLQQRFSTSLLQLFSSQPLILSSEINILAAARVVISLRLTLAFFIYLNKLLNLRTIRQNPCASNVFQTKCSPLEPYYWFSKTNLWNQR